MNERGQINKYTLHTGRLISRYNIVNEKVEEFEYVTESNNSKSKCYNEKYNNYNTYF